MPINIDKDKPNVKTMWLVTVKLYGTIPIKLQVSSNKCNVKIKGK